MMTGPRPPVTPVLELPALGEKVADDPLWQFPSPGHAAGEGVAHLRVWRLGGQDGNLAVVIEAGLGASVPSAIPQIHAKLAGCFPGPLTLLEYYPGGRQAVRRGRGHLDLIAVTGRQVRWRRIWPVPAASGNRAALEGWMKAYGELITGLSPGER